MPKNPKSNSILQSLRALPAAFLRGIGSGEYRRTPMLVEEVEPRILHSADFALALPADGAVPPHAEQRLIVSGGEYASQAAHVQPKQSTELVFVDTRTPDHQKLVDDIRTEAGDGRNIEVLLLDSQRDGIGQITSALSGRTDVSAIHIVSHGSSGAVQVGNGMLDLQSLGAQSAEIASWSGALTQDADILIYGCDVAGSPDGRTLVDALSRLTGADVAASENLTGNAAAQGDWNLEYTTGRIEAALAIDAQTQQAWTGVLANTSPVLSGAENLTPITEDAAANPGTQVSTLLAGHVTDPDAGALSGIAVTAANNTNGTWQYSIDAGGTWNNLGSPGDTSARLLRSNDFVRFVPNADWNGTVSNGLTFRAWDQTTGTAGGTVDLTVPATVRDNFDTKAYNNNNGTAAWSSAWIDIDNNVNGGDFKILNSGVLQAKDSHSTDYLYRQANLATASNATLSFDYTSDLNTGIGGLVEVQMSDNGGASYTTIGTFSSTINTGTGNFSADISAYAAATSRIRFLAVAPTSSSVGILVDNLQISYLTPVAGGATAFSGATAASSITVNAVNDAPVLTPTAPALTTITEDQTGNAGQTVASIVGASISDGDTGALPGIAVTAISSGNGTWQYSVNGGTSWSAIGTVSNTSALLLGSSDRVRFEPDTQNGTSASITYRAWDQSSGTASTKVDASTNGGATAFSSAIDTASLTVTAINDAPVHNVPAAQNTVTNTAIIFSTGNSNAISVGDVDAGFNPVKMTLSVSNGTLTLGGTSGLIFSVGTGTGGDASLTFTGTIADINAALDGLRFDPTPGYSGSSGLDVTTDDLGSGGAGGPKSVTNTVVMNVTFVNNAPVLSGGNALGSISEDTTTNPGTSVSALVAGHVSDDAGALSGMAVIGVDNSNGTWQYSTNSGATWNDFGTPSAASARLLAADGNSYVRFVPNADWNGVVANGLSFRAWDRTSGAAGGTADTTTPVTNTVSDSFTAVSYSNNDGTASWSAAWVDTDNNPSGGSITVAGGQLVLSTLIGTDSIYREADLSGATGATLSFSYNNLLGVLGTVSLEASSGGSYTTLATFSSGSNTGSGTFSTDISAYIAANTRIRLTMNGLLLGGSLHTDNLQISYVTPANGGTTSFSTATASSSIAVNSVNDAPTLSAPAALAVIEDAASAITGISIADIDAGGASMIATFTVPQGTLAAVSGGSVIVGGSATALTLTGSIANINAFIAASSLTYTTASNDTNGVTLGVSVGDQGNIGSGGPLSSAVSSVTLNVTNVNDAPTGASNTVSTPEDTAYVFSGADFSFGDPGDNPADTLLAVKVTALPSAGSLTLAGAAVSAGQFISATDISLGRLKFMPAANANASGYASFTFQLQDNGGIANGGIDLDPVARTMIIDVTAVNDTPVLATNAGLAVNEGASASIGAASLQVTDIDNPAGQLAFTVTALPANGHLELTGNPGAPITSFTQDDIDNTRLVYVHDGSQTASDSFSFSVADGAGGSIATTTFAITVNAINNAPANTVPGTQTTEQGSILMFSAGNGNAIAIADADAGANAVEVKLSASNGTLTLAGTNGLVFALGDGNGDTAMRFTGTIANINAALNGLQFMPGAGYAGTASLSIDSNDLGNTGAGGMLSASSVVSINVAASPSAAPVTPVTPILPALVAPTVLPPSAAAPVIQPASISEASSVDTTPTFAEVPAAGGSVETDSQVLAMDTASTAQAVRGAFYVVNPSALRNPGAFRATYTLSATQWLLSGDEAQAAADSGIASGLNVGYEKAGNALQNPALFDGLDSLRNELQEQSRADELIVASSAAASLGLSVGYVLWLLRGGVLVSSLLSSLPAWRLVDPLPILGRLDDDEDDEEDDSLESLVAADNTAPAPQDSALDRKTEFAHAKDVTG